MVRGDECLRAGAGLPGTISEVVDEVLGLALHARPLSCLWLWS
jgi:hypothetical protein